MPNNQLPESNNQRLKHNRSCHLRDRDLHFRTAIKLFRKIHRRMDQKLRTKTGKEELQELMSDLQYYLKKAMFHASLARVQAANLKSEQDSSLEEQLISDFLLTFEAACYNIKYLISHCLQLLKLEQDQAERPTQFEHYLKKMISIDEESLRKLLAQLKRRISFFNKTMKIQI